MAYRDNRSGGGRDSRGGGGRRFGGRSRFGGGGRGEDRQMFKVICANCGKPCEVPFRPTGSKPVYCRDCFRTIGEGAGPSRADDRGSKRQSYDSQDRNLAPRPQSREFEELNEKLDKILRLLSSEKSKSTEVQSESAELVKKKAKVKKLAPIEITEEAPLEAEVPLETPIE